MCHLAVLHAVVYAAYVLRVCRSFVGSVEISHCILTAHSVVFAAYTCREPPAVGHLPVFREVDCRLCLVSVVVLATRVGCKLLASVVVEPSRIGLDSVGIYTRVGLNALAVPLEIHAQTP